MLTICGKIRPQKSLILCECMYLFDDVFLILKQKRFWKYKNSVNPFWNVDQRLLLSIAMNVKTFYKRFHSILSRSEIRNTLKYTNQKHQTSQIPVSHSTWSSIKSNISGKHRIKINKTEDNKKKLKPKPWT